MGGATRLAMWSLVAAGALLPSAIGAQNLVTNPSFDVDASGWVVANSDVEAVYRPDVGSDLSTGSGPGSVEIRFSFWNGASSGVYQELPATAGVTYEFGMSSFIPAADNPATATPLFIQWYDERHSFLGQDAFSTVGTADVWLRVEDQLTAPPGTATVRVFPTVQNADDPDETRPGVAIVDDVYFAVAGATNTVQELFYPAGASVAGLEGTFWTTNGWFVNRSAADLELFGAFLGRNRDNSAAVRAPISLGTIPAGGSVVLDDLVAALGGAGQTGGIFLRAETISGIPLPILFATSYTSTPNPAGAGAYGQGIPAVGAGSGVRQVAPGAFQNDRLRTNVGVLNTSGREITVRVTILDAAGAEAATASWTLPPYAHRQLGLPALGVAELATGSVVFELTSGTGSYRGYTSTVDADTGDAVYTAGQ